IGFPLRIEAPGTDPAPRVDATARMLGIEDLLDRFPAQLSGGERQRVAMGRAVARHPSAFLMDEPLSNLDAKLRNHLRAEMSRLTRELGVTTVYVTHDQGEAMSLGDRVAVLRGGVLQQVGSPRTVYALPANVFVAAFIGIPRINLLRGLVRAPLDGAMTISLGKQFLRLPEPLSLDHQLLRVQQGREVIVGLRSEAVRIAEAGAARPGEVVLTGLVEHVEFQGHEVLVHFDTGSRPAVVPDLEAPRPHPGRTERRRRRDGTVLDRLRERAGALRPGAVATLEPAAGPTSAPAGGEPRLPGDLIVRTAPDVRPRPAAQRTWRGPARLPAPGERGPSPRPAGGPPWRPYVTAASLWGGRPRTRRARPGGSARRACGGMYIGGAWRPAAGPDVIEVVNPAD